MAKRRQNWFWIVEIREYDFQPWRPHIAEPTRRLARQLCRDYRKNGFETRVRKYVRAD